MISQCPTSFRHYTLSRLCPLTQDTHPRPSSHRTNSLPVFPISPSNTAHHTATRSNVPKSSRQRVTHICTIIHSASKSQKARMTQATRRGAGRPKAVRNMADDIMNLVDEHLAWQVEAEERELQRRGSVGTLIVDWDGTGEVRLTTRSHLHLHVLHHQGEQTHKPLQPHNLGLTNTTVSKPQHAPPKPEHATLTLSYQHRHTITAITPHPNNKSSANPFPAAAPLQQ
jgi:hypothetical protein